MFWCMIYKLEVKNDINFLLIQIIEDNKDVDIIYGSIGLMSSIINNKILWCSNNSLLRKLWFLTWSEAKLLSKLSMKPAMSGSSLNMNPTLKRLFRAWILNFLTQVFTSLKHSCRLSIYVGSNKTDYLEFGRVGMRLWPSSWIWIIKSVKWVKAMTGWSKQGKNYLTSIRNLEETYLSMIPEQWICLSITSISWLKIFIPASLKNFYCSFSIAVQWTNVRYIDI